MVQCFDENSGYKSVEDFIEQQNGLPLKLRFKYLSVSKFFISVMSNVQLVFERNRDFLLLSKHDRVILLESTVEYTAIIGAMFILRRSRLLDDFVFFQSTEMIFHRSAMTFVKRIIDQFDSDDTFIKLILSILSFSTTNYITYKNNSQINLTNIKAILPVQDMHIDLTWRYLAYKYGEHQAVIRFSSILRCLFSVTETIVEANEQQNFMKIIDSIIDETEQTFY